MKKYLIIRFSSIGDIVLTTALIRCLKLQQPEAEVHFITKKQFLPLLEANPYLDKIYTISKNISEVLPQLKAENYSNVVDLHKSLRSRELLLRLQKPYSSFPKLNFQKFLICSFKINILPAIHIVDRYFKAVQKYGVNNDGKGLDYFIPEKERVSLGSLPKTHLNGYIALVIGGKHATKQMPPAKLVALCKEISKPIIILGGKEDRDVAELIVSQSGKMIFNACGLYNLNQSASLLASADRVITHDTGLMHIAAALKKDILSIWGNTVPGFGMYQYFQANYTGDSQIAEVKGLSCRPCSKLGYKACPKIHFNCMNQINVEYISKWANSNIPVET